MKTTTPAVLPLLNSVRRGGAAAFAAVVLMAGCEGHLVTFDRDTGAPKSTQIAQYDSPVWPAPTRTCASAVEDPYQLGVATRIGIYDFENGGTDLESDGFPYYECAESPSDVYFSETDIGHERFEMQTTFAATAVALAYLDKLVHDPRVGGWDYDTVNFPKMKGLEPALLVTLNDPMCLLVDPACAENEGGSDHEQLPGDNACTPHMPAGRFAPVSRTHEEAHAHDYPIPSPAAFGEHGYLYGRVALCASDGTQIPSTMFHEVGHYLDHNLGEYDGLSYPWGVTSDEPEGGELTGCCMDSYREGAALAETLGQLVVLYMYRRIYPGMDYTISGAAGPQGSCRLAELGIPETTIVHEDCLSNINGGNDPELLNPDLEVESMLRTFRDDLGFRPQASATGRCDWRTGYKIPSLFQAWWELLFAQECTGDGETLECVDYTGAPVDADYADRYMMALMWALKQGNNVGYVEFWDRMETFIANEFPGDLGLFQHVRDLHDIHPINADGAPVCAAGDPAGPG